MKSNLSKKLIVIFHFLVIILLTLKASFNIYINYVDLYFICYLTIVLIVLSYRDKELNFLRSLMAILISTFLGLFTGFVIYNTPIGESLEKEHLNKFFEKNKETISLINYNIYLKNKDDLNELRYLRKELKELYP